MRLPCPSVAFLRASAMQIDGSLTPFLYQTATIQQWFAPYAPHQRERRRYASSQRTSIPFEQPIADASDATLDGPSELEARSTISSKEKRVFAKLLDPSYDPQAALKARGKPIIKPKKPASRDRSVQGDRQFSDVELQAQHEQLLERKRKTAMAPQLRLNELQAEQGLQATFFEETEELRYQRAKALAKAREQFSKALTDKELWQELEKSAFNSIKKHFSPGQVIQPNRVKAAGSAADQIAKSNNARETEAAILTHNYPYLLVAFLDELREHFPSSQLAFSILPTVKSLGRQSYVLGASTQLYNGIILDTWRTFSDFLRINDLLLEMENAGLEFDFDTLEVLNKIRRQGERILKGERGELLKRVWELDSMMSGWTTVVGWIPKVQERLEADALRKANESEESEMGDSVMEEDWHDELAAMEEQEEALRRAAASL